MPGLIRSDTIPFPWLNHMSTPIIRRLPDPESVSQAAAEEFIRLAAECISARGKFTVALAGGSTPKRMYQLLGSAGYKERVNWARVEFFWGDERCVPSTHADSNFRMANEAFLQSLPICSPQIHRMQAEREDRDQAAEDYQAEIARVFGVYSNGQPPAFDLILVGMGGDGHTLSLFPHTAALSESTRWVVANRVEKLQTFRLTFTVPMLNRASNVLFCVAGADKAIPLVEVLEGPADGNRLPSQRSLAGQGVLTWLVDEAAARELKAK